MNIPEKLRYTKEHEWVRVEGTQAVIGITDYAQSELGDVVFVELPAVGKKAKANASITTVESVKAVSDIFAPVGGTIAKVNEKLADNPELVNQDPYGEGWIMVVELDNLAEADNLLDASQYGALLGGN